MSSSVGVEDVNAIITGLQIVSYVDVAALTYRICDFLQTLDWEIRYLWRGHKDWSLFKVVYIMARYQGFLDQPLFLLYYHGTGLSPSACHIMFGLGCASALTGGIAAEVLTFLRIYVLAGCTKKMAWYLTVQFMISIVILVVFAALYLKSLAFAPSPSPEHIACYMSRSNKSWLALLFVWTLAHQLIVLSLALYFGLASFRHSSNPLLWIFYRDGTLYLMLLVAAAIANIAAITIASPVYQNLFMLLQATLHSTLSTRIILKMREMASRDLALLQMTQSAGEFTTQIEFENYSSRQRNFMSQNGGAFSQDIHFPGELRYATRASRISLGSVRKDPAEE
ncbi:hypothetical protein BKA70DRAFT_1267077 [Coprinopsis sp. MPI-PUGE-AT-0042]|nr:hypothetical protein BKA70DRAFT_1267077 [Coprinopsis sp. MPI-PUGE-AT-0042]